MSNTERQAKADLGVMQARNLLYDFYQNILNHNQRQEYSDEISECLRNLAHAEN